MNVIHIGFPKTATSLLQQHVFNQLSDRVNFVNDEDAKNLFYRLFNEDDSLLDSWGVQNAFKKICDQKAPINLFSYEFLTGVHHQTRFMNRTLIAKRLKVIGFHKIIISIRNQFDILESTYKQYVKDGGVLNFSEFINFKGTDSKNYFPVHYFCLDYYDYYRIIKLYSDLFGFNNLCVLQYEDLKKEQFIRKLAKFLEIPDRSLSLEDHVNQSLPKREIQILRIINHFTYSVYRPSHLISKKISTRFFYRLLNRIPKSTSSKKKTFITNELRSFILSYYKHTNKKLADEYNLDLDDSYPM